MEAEGEVMDATDLKDRIYKYMPSLNRTEKLLVDLVLHWIEARYELVEKK